MRLADRRTTKEYFLRGSTAEQVMRNLTLATWPLSFSLSRLSNISCNGESGLGQADSFLVALVFLWNYLFECVMRVRTIGASSCARNSRLVLFARFWVPKPFSSRACRRFFVRDEISVARSLHTLLVELSMRIFRVDFSCRVIFVYVFGCTWMVFMNLTEVYTSSTRPSWLSIITSKHNFFFFFCKFGSNSIELCTTQFYFRSWLSQSTCACKKFNASACIVLTQRYVIISWNANISNVSFDTNQRLSSSTQEVEQYFFS